MKLKVATIVGTRPEIIRLAAVLKECDRVFDHVLIHTGQNWDYNLNDVFFEELGLRKPDHNLQSVGGDLGETIGNIIAKSYKLLTELKPEALLILGDTNSALAAISAKRLKIPIFHMEAGNRCFDQNVPEEINRKLVDHVSDVNMTYTEHGRRYLLSEGYRKEHLFVTGSPMPEVLTQYASAIEKSDVLGRLKLKERNYFVVSTHREENVDNDATFDGLIAAIKDIATRYKMPVVMSVHPRTRNRLEKKGVSFPANVVLSQPFGLLDYVKLQKNAACVLSDSGTLSEESAFLGFPGVLIRTSTERPEVLDKGTVVIGGVTTESVVSAVELAMADAASLEQRVIPPDYRDLNVSKKVVRIIQSYTPIVNRVVWNKQK